MRIAIIDADLIGRKKHRFPNLACMKMGGYYKEKGHEVILITDYGQLYYDENLWSEYQQALDDYTKMYKKSVRNSEVTNALSSIQIKCFNENNIKFDKIFISKVFTDTEIDEDFLRLNIVEYGGTGFYFDKAPNLPDEIEHHMPDYHLYDEWINKQIENGVKSKEFKEYTDYSIGFLTRGCFRKCSFCVNQKYDHVFKHSPLDEFYDSSRKKICLLDDNFLGCPHWKELLLQLKNTNKSFKFKQGLDERILTKEKCEILFSCKYDSDIYFAFDDVNDYAIIEQKLKLIKEYSNRQCIFYVLCGFDKYSKYDDEFWYQDIVNTFKRIELLMRYKCIPYIMRFNKYEESPYRGMYINLARWCNQPSFFKKKSFEEYCKMDCHVGKATEKYLDEFLKCNPEFIFNYSNYLTMKY